jgi:hypothetical protein
MRFRKEILRGVRLAAILFAALLAALTSYRMLRVTRAAPLPSETHEVAPPAAPSATTATPKPAPAVSGPDVPPPPSPVRPVIRRNPRRSSVPDVTVMKNVEAVITVPPEPTAPVEVPSPVVAEKPPPPPSLPVVAADTTSALPTVASPPSDAAKTPKHKGFFRSFGRLLRGGKKDEQGEALQQH